MDAETQFIENFTVADKAWFTKEKGKIEESHESLLKCLLKSDFAFKLIYNELLHEN